MRIASRFGISVAVLGVVLSTVPAAGAAPPGEHRPVAASRADGSTVTLITGDRVTVHGTNGISITPGKNRENATFTRSTYGGHTHVIPNDARKLVATGQLDRRLFDITTLVEFGYDDAHRDTVPLIVTHPAGKAAPRLARDARALPSINGVAVAAAKDTTTWEALTDGDTVATTASGVTRVWLDGKRAAVLDRSAAQIGAPAAWEAGLTGEGVRVAVLDTGVDQTHPDLADREIAEQNFTDSPDTVDNYGHGTHVASIVAGTGAKSGGKFRGIASGAEILDGKVLDDYGSGFDSWIIAGMEWAAEQEADIINMSLGGADTPEIDPLEQAVESLTAEHGVLFVIAAGNGYRGAIASPGSAPSALTVGAVDRENALADFSLTGPTVGDGAVKPDLTAPGVDIVAALHAAGTIAPPVEDGYTALSGTSMATPHVVGAAALIAQQHPDWTGQRLKAALAATATPTQDLSVFQQGSGRVDVAGAMNAAVVTEPSSLSLGILPWPREDDEPVTRTLTYRNLGETEVTLDLTVTATDPNGDPVDAFSLSADEVALAAGGTAEVTVTGDPSTGPVDGAYSGTVVATSTTGRVTRTPVGITREEEQYNLTLNYTDAPGHAVELYAPMVVGLDTYTMDDAVDEDGSVTIRLPKGRYLVDHLVIADEGEHFLQVVQPGIVLDRDQTFEIDLAAAKPNSVTPPRTADPSIADIAYQMDTENSSFTGGFLIFGDLGLVSTAQIGDPLPGTSMTSWLYGTWVADEAIYALAWFFDRYPTGFTKVVEQRELATVRTEVGGSPLSTSGTPMWQPQSVSGSTMAVSIGHTATIPGTATTYVTTDNVRWKTELAITDADFNHIASFEKPLRSFKPGSTHHDRFNHPVFGPGLPLADAPWVYRDANDIVATIPLFTDGDGNAGFSATESGSTKLYLGAELVGESPFGGAGYFTDLPAEPGDYRLTTEATRAADYGLSTSVSAEWTFTSAQVDDQAALPLNVVRFLPRLDDDGTAPTGEFRVPLRVRDQTGATHRPKQVTVEASYDDGQTWHQVPVTSRQEAVLDHPAGASSVSLRASATDRDGNTVNQTVIRAYTLR
ncbi:S8 family peptidase [Actinophytocola sediminis]